MITTDKLHFIVANLTDFKSRYYVIDILINHIGRIPFIHDLIFDGAATGSIFV